MSSIKWFFQRAAKGSQSRVHLYTFSWNEERILPFFFRHYDPFVERYVFYDDSSSDATLEILASHPKVEVRRFERTTPGSYVASALTLQNSMWKESRGLCDWVIVTAADEHLQHPELEDYLVSATRKGITAIPSLGYEMVSTEFPDSYLHLATSLVWGTPAVLMSRFSLFNPNAIKETRFSPGQHHAEPLGKVCYPPRDDLLNLHYKMLGREYVCSRYALLRSGLGEVDRANRWGHHYDISDEDIKIHLEKLKAVAINVGLPGLDHHATYPERWWRQESTFKDTRTGLLSRWGQDQLKRLAKMAGR